MMNWVITLPQKVEWADYQKELDAVKSGTLSMNFKVPHFPKEMAIGDKCYLVWRGKVRGWMTIVGMKSFPAQWQCMVTGKMWSKGKYIQRSGPFHEVDGPEMRGFQGIRKFSL